jgi:NADH:ubiquinone oxidoreductase subunit 4 (subunit M)
MGELNPSLAGLKLELTAREVATLAPLAVLAICLGVYPDWVLSYLRAPVAQLLSNGVVP